MNKMVWYQLYAFIVGRAYDNYDNETGYVIWNYCIFPSTERSLKNCMISYFEDKPERYRQ